MEGSPVRGQQKIPIVQLNCARSLQSFQAEVVRLLGTELQHAEIMFGIADGVSNIPQLPTWIKSHLDRQQGLLKKLQQGEMVGISGPEDTPSPRPATVVRSSIVLIPVMTEHRLSAAVALVAPLEGPQLSAEDLETARQFAYEAAPILERLQQIEELRRENQQLAAKAERIDRAEQATAVLHEENYGLSALLQMRSHQQMNLAHELRTPLAAIRGYVRMIQDGRGGEISDTQREYLRIVANNTNKLIGLIAWMSSVAELNAQHLTLSVFDFREVLSASAKASERKLQDKSLEWLQHVAEEPFVLIGDRERLACIVSELIAVAVKLAEDGGTINAHLAHGREGEIMFKLQVSGSSIPPETLSTIFERPFTVFGKPTALDMESGVINLSGVYDVVGMHGGRVFVNSTAGQGATFLFTLPAVTTGEEKSHEQAVNSGRRRR